MKRGFLFSSRLITAVVVGAFFFVVRGCLLVVFVEALDVRPDYTTYLSRRF